MDVTTDPIQEKKCEDEEEREVVKDPSMFRTDGWLDKVGQSTSNHGQPNEYDDLENIVNGDVVCIWSFDEFI